MDKKTIIWGTAVGLFFSMILGSSLVIVGAKAGIIPGSSPLVILFCWVIFGRFVKKDLKSFLAISQVAGSAGGVVTAGVVFVAPILQVMTIDSPDGSLAVNIPSLYLSSFAGIFMGWGFVGLSIRNLLTDPRLPAPEAVACDRMIKTAVANPLERPALCTSLLPGVGLGMGLSFLLSFHYMKKAFYAFKLGLGKYSFAFPISAAPVYIGIGALLTLPTAILIFSGGLINSVVNGVTAAHSLPGTTFRWVGGAAMCVAVLYSTVSFFIKNKISKAKANEDHLTTSDKVNLEVDGKTKTMFKVSIAFGACLLFINMMGGGISFFGFIIMAVVALVLSSFLCELGGLLSLQVGSSASPISGTIFMALLVLSLVGLMINIEGLKGAIFLVPILTASCVAIAAANDSSQDFKTMMLNGFPIRHAFLSQLIGLIGGAIVVPITLWLAHEAHGLGSAELPAPQASFFASVLRALFYDGKIPVLPILVGTALGLVAIAIESWGKKRGQILSSLAFAVGIYLPAVIGTGILLGGLARYLGTRNLNKTTNSGILVAAGLVTGDALFSLVFGGAIIAKLNIKFLEASHHWPTYVGFIFTFAVLGVVWMNYKKTK